VEEGEHVRKIIALVPILALAVAVGGTAAQARPHAGQGMYGIQITNYRINKDHTVTINVKIRGLTMAGMSKHNVAGKGHWNIYVGRKLNNYSVNPKAGKTKVLQKGDYKVYVTLVNNDGTPLTEPARSKTISVMVDAA
jgi:hypothetical protein